MQHEHWQASTLGLGCGKKCALTSGLSLAEVARQFGIPYNSVKSKARRENWEVNLVFGKKYWTKEERLRHTIKATQKTVSELVAENGAASRIHLSQAIRKGAEHLGELEGPEVVEKHVAVNSLAKSAATVHGWDDPKRAEGNLTILNLQLLAMRPAELAANPVREVEAEQSGELKADASQEGSEKSSEAGQEQEETIRRVSVGGTSDERVRRRAGQWGT